jgi:exonuclease SbcC
VIPCRLMLRNFMCYREEVPPLDLEGIDIACLSGDNGSGKSALLDAITWVLWGQARLKSDDDLIALGAQEMEVDLTFKLDGLEYRVIRKRSKARKTGQSWLDFQVRSNGTWKALSGATIRETQQQILNTLRMDYDIFSNSAYLRQGHADEFTRKEPSRRKQVLADILGLDAFEALETRAKERARQLDGNIKVLEGQINELERQAEKREQLAQLVMEAEQRVEDLQFLVEQAEAALAQATERVQMLEARKPLRDDLRSRLESMRAEGNQLAREIGQLRRDLAAAEQVLERRATIEAGVAELQAAQAALERLDGLTAEYDALQKRRRIHEDALKAAEHQLRSDVRLLESELRGLREQAAKRPALVAEINKLSAELDGFAAIEDELEAARRKRSELSERSQASHDLQLKVQDLKHQIEMRHDSLVSTREELKRRIRDADEQLRDEGRWRSELAQLQAERAQLEGQLSQIEALRQQEHEAVERSGALRAACETIKSQGEEINKKLALLKGDDVHACPMCGSELGHDGIAHIEEEYNRQRMELRQQYSSAKREADELDAQLKVFRAEIQQLERKTAELPQIAGRIARLENQLRQAQEVGARRTEDQRTLADLEIQLVKGNYERGVRAELAQLEAQLAGMGNSATLNREMKQIEQRIGMLEAKINQQAKLRADLDTKRLALRDIDNAEPALHETEQQLRELQTTIDLNDFAHDERAKLAQVDNELNALGYTPELHRAARAKVRELEHWSTELQRLQGATEQVQRIQRELERAEELLGRRTAEIESSEAQLAAFDEELRALGPAIRARDEAQDRLKVQRRDLSVRERDLGERRADLKRAEDAAAELMTLLAQREKLIAKKELFDELTQSFGKKGVQAMLIETAIPEIEREANQLLARMTDNQMHLTFETQRDTKKGDVSETLDIKIADGLGTRGYDAFSGGEAFRLNFAIRVALAKLLAKRAGARLETLVIDEGFGTQDTRGRERLVEAITSVQGEFKKILVVTHIQELKELFPVQIEITKTPRGSMWAIG